MANRKISDLTALTAPAAGDLLPIVDISEAAAADKNKKITYGELLSSAPAGSAAAPSFSFDGDPNSGLYSAGADQVAISTGGSGRLFVKSSGLIEINPSATEANSRMLLVRGSEAANGAVLLKSNSTPDGNTRGFLLQSFGASSDAYVWQQESSPLILGTNATERLRITSAGLVGVGSSSPQGQLHVEGGQTYMNRNGAGNQQVLQLNNSDTTAGTQIVKLAFGSSGATKASINAAVYGNDYLAFNTGSDTERMRLTGTGLGIGVSSPSFPLSVSGNSGTDVAIVNGIGGAAYYGVAGNKPINFETNGSTKMSISAGGSVGIGTTSPSARLNIAEGNANAVSTTSTDVNRVLLTDTSGSTSAGVGYSLDFEGTYGGLGRIAISKSNSATAGTTRDNGAFRLFLNQNLGQDSYAAFTEALTIDSGGTDQGLIYRFRGTEQIRVDSSGRLLVGTSTSSATVTAVFSGNSAGVAGNGVIHITRGNTASNLVSGANIGKLAFTDSAAGEFAAIEVQADAAPGASDYPGRLVFSTTADGASSPTERMRITSAGFISIAGDTDTGFSQPNANQFSITCGNSEVARFGSFDLALGSTKTSVGSGIFNNSSTDQGILLSGTFNALLVNRASGSTAFFNRLTDDGTIISLAQAGTAEGTISVSGTTVSYNGAHLSRWSQLPSGVERTEILRGSVLSNLDEMCEWGDEENEQLNRMKVSDVEGDKNVSGVFQAWDDDDDTYTNDFYCAMTGDFIIRIAEGVTVERGDLLMSAGDGTAKPQDDDIIRSKTIAKVTSTNVSCTYEDGSYCVPCVLMAC